MNARPAEDAFDADYYTARYRYSPTSIYWWSVRYYSRLVLRLLPRRTSGRARVLELGCGTGHVLKHLVQYCETWGLDVSPEAVRRARSVAPAARLLRARGEALPFQNASFDAALARHVLEHLSEPDLAIRELHRVLRPGGLLLAAMPNPTCVGRSMKGTRWYGFQDPTHISLLAPSRWAELFTAEGFRVLRRWGDGLWDVPYLPRLPSSLQLLLFGLPAALQVLTKTSFIPTWAGESAIFLLRASVTSASHSG